MANCTYEITVDGKVYKFSSDLELDSFLNAYYQDMVVGQPSFILGANKVIATIKPEEYRAILEWDVILSYANYLSDEVVDANFDFFGKTFSGKKENNPRWKRATNQVEGQMGEALGKMYVERYFPASSKERSKLQETCWSLIF